MDVSKDLLLWVDVETTALDPDDGELLEVGMALTDMRGESQGEPEAWGLHYPRLALNRGTLGAVGMHVENGLIGDVLFDDSSKAETMNRNAVRRMDEWVRRTTCGASGAVHVAGRNPQFDMRWLRAKLKAYDVDVDLWKLSHRRMDITAIVLACETVGLGERLRDSVERTNHRALSCIREEIGIYRNAVGLLESLA